MEVSLAKRKHAPSHGLFWATIILIIITMALELSYHGVHYLKCSV